jgi:ApaG protein
VPTRLIDRHWVITDANGRSEVRGEIGEQPCCAGRRFRIHGAVLETALGTIHGSYGMLAMTTAAKADCSIHARSARCTGSRR